MNDQAPGVSKMNRDSINWIVRVVEKGTNKGGGVWREEDVRRWDFEETSKRLTRCRKISMT